MIGGVIFAGLALLGIALYYLVREILNRVTMGSQHITCLICGRKNPVTRRHYDRGFFTCRCGQQVLLTQAKPYSPPKSRPRQE